MKFGIDFFPDAAPDRVSGRRYFEDALDLAEIADDLGYDSAKIVEHYFTSYGGYSPDPCVFLAACSQRARRLRMVTGAVLPVFNHPLKLAGQLTMLDAISGGRLDVGVARAFMPYEFDAFGISMEESRARFEEGVEALRRLWTEERVTFEGKFHRFENVTSLPRPTQTPHPPLWVAAVVSPESFVWTGERGYNLMVVPYLGEHHELAEKLDLYRRAYRDHGHEARRGPGEVMMVLHLYVAPTRTKAHEEARPFMERYLTNFRAHAKAWTGRQSGQYTPYSALEQMLHDITYERVLDETRAIIGDPDDVARQLTRVRDTFGEVYPSFQVNFGTMDKARARRSLELFARHVMPSFPS
jgi:alkanesulfonate monooxygenase SsuD/methylene tetrahydromethanopterin reductase-like flavin-dependent oxidoreductase (luciferase family)